MNAAVRILPSALWLAAAALHSASVLAADHAPAKAAEPVSRSARTVPAEEGTSKVATAPPVAAVDPLEHLRLRLADRLSNGKPNEAAGSYDVRVVAKSAPAEAAPKVPATVRGSSRGGAHGAAPGAKGAEAHARIGHWAYEGPAGPQTWGGLKPEFALCGSGQRQSPIDIRGGLAVDLEPVRFDYQASRFGVIDNGHTVQVNVAPGNAIEVGGRRFELKQFHFHRPSEERIDGRQFEMSVHLVHQDEQGRLAVVTVLLDRGPAQPAVQKVWNNLPLEKNEEVAARTALDINEILPSDRRYYTYMGSLTTPPCSEGVQWVVMRQPVALSPEQIDLFARIYPMNARPLQQAAGRRIMQSN
jgi:carbonic anhydrase